MHPNQRIVFLLQVTFDECDVHGTVYEIVVTDHREVTVFSLHHLLADSLDIAFFLEPVSNQVSNRANADIVSVRKFFQIGTARHTAILIKNFDDDCS